MEHEEQSDNGTQDTRQDVRCHYKVRPHVVKTSWLIDSPIDNWIASDNNEPIGHCTVEQHIHKELVVVESNAVSNPWTMMIHLKNASIALGAVMASVWLGLVAPLTDPDSAELLSLHRCLHPNGGLLLGSLTNGGLVSVVVCYQGSGRGM